MELLRSNNQTITEDPWYHPGKGSLVLVAQFCLLSFALGLGEDKRAAGTSKLPLPHGKPGLMEGTLHV